MSENESNLWMDPDKAESGEIKPGEPIPVEGGEVVIAHGQTAAFFPDQPDVVRWKDAERNNEHQAITVGPYATCSCGWKADGTGVGGWTAHFIEATRK